MRDKRIISIFLLLAIFITSFSSGVLVYAQNGTADLTKREVYLHAQDRNPTGVAPSSTVVKNEPFNLYFSIDNPNKGRYNDTENDLSVKAFVDNAVEQKRIAMRPDAEALADREGISDPVERNKFIEDYLAPILSLEAKRAEQIKRHEESQYDLNGYTVRVYYDNEYFKLQDGVDVSAPIDYTVPDKTITDSDTDEGSRDPENNSTGNISYSTGYSAYTESAGFDNQKGLSYADVTVFFYGSFLPQEKNDLQGNKWYDLCALPLIPIKTGSTQVSIEIGGDSSKSSLVLFSKHSDNPDYKKEFEFSAINGGIHTINIVNSIRPEAPVVSILPIDYVKGDKVKLICGDITCSGAEEKHDIYYCIDNTLPFQKYEGQEFTFDKTTTISCYAVKKSDLLQEYKSETVSFRYEILPDKPILFADVAGQPITNVYNSLSPFLVYCDTEETYNGEIGTDENIYYTFSGMIAEKNIDSDGWFKTDGQDPKTGWVKAEKSLGLRIDVNETVKVNLVTVRENAVSGQEISETSTYFLGIRPSVVTATPSSCENPGEVELHAGDGCEIYYTTDGSDPVANGVKYSSSILVNEDTLIRAAAKKDGVYSLVSDFTYTVTNVTGSVISSNYPSGEYEGKIKVSLTSDNPDDEILYSTDGGNTWTTYAGSIDVDKSVVIKAKVQGSEKIFDFSYKIKPLSPVFAPTGTYFAQAEDVTIYCRETVNDGLGGTNKDDYTLFYTLDGSDPATNPNAYNTSNSPVNTAVVKVNGETVIKAAVRTKDGVWSDVVTNTYDVLSYKLAPPIPTLEPGQYTADKMYTKFFNEQDDCEIYYTISDVYVKDPVSSDTAPNVHYVKGSDIELTGRKIIKAITVNKALNLKSDVAVFEYIINPPGEAVTTCYADKNSGVYETPSGSEEFLVRLYSKDPSDVIQYKTGDGSWTLYDASTPIKIESDCVLYVKGSDNVVVSYSYEFIPKPPVSSLLSGRYILTEPPYKVKLMLPEGYSENDYYLFFRNNTDNTDILANGSSTMDFEIKSSVSYKAYVVDKATGRRSENAVFYYIIEPEELSAGEIYTIVPFDVKSGNTKYISTHLLSESGYNEGIKLETKAAGTKIKYKYTYTKTDGSVGRTDYQFFYKSNPILVTSSMKDITVYAYLTDSVGTEIPGTDAVFKYNFENIAVPQFSTTELNIRNDYPGDSDYIIYYTLDGTDPSDPRNASRIRYDGGKINLSQNTTVKTVYYKACDDPSCPCASSDATHCRNYVYGEVGTFYYEAPKYISVGGGGGGGGSTSVETRLYTKDIFGNEHTSHISYIKGYPDGSVKADGNITREEVTAILYRIKDKEYDEPFSSTGNVFPDVKADRWSVTEIEFMASENVVLGYPDGEFKPARNLTRAEFAALIYRYCNLSKSDIKNKFTDLSQEHWAYSEILSLLKTGLMQGYEDSTFQPEKNITRAEVITVINKILGRKPLESYVKSLDFNPFNDLLTQKWYYTDVLEATITHDYYLNTNGYEHKWENWK